jgi:restriction system protein
VRHNRRLYKRNRFDLVDGEQLAEKLKEFQLGIKTQMIEKVTIDKDWFTNL